MQNLHKFITNADQFGALSQVSFFNSGVKFRTIYGGILSLIILSLGSSYFIYLIYMWQTFQIPPTITVQSKFENAGGSFSLTRPLFVFSLEVDEVDEQTQKLQSKGDIYQYSIGSFTLKNQNLTKNTPGFDCSQPPRQQIDYFDPICINLDDKNQTYLFQNYTNRNQDTYVYFSIDYCDPKVNNKCMNFEDQSKIFETYSSWTSWRLTLITQEIDLKSGKITDIPQDYYFPANPYQNVSANFFSLRIRKGTYIIDDGILFPNIRTIEIVKSIELLNYVAQFIDPMNNVPLIGYIEYHLDRTEEIITVTYPKLGQILADLGSILQVLLLFGIIVSIFNYTRMQMHIEKVLLSIYFPEMKLFEFKYNWRGKLLSISWMGQLLRDFDFKRMKVFKESTGLLLKSKLNYLNILHEISRLQIQQQLKTTRSAIIQQQSLGYVVKLPKSEIIQVLDDEKVLDNEKVLDDLDDEKELDDKKLKILDWRDFQILCLSKIEQNEQDILILDEDRQVYGHSSGLNDSPINKYQQKRTKRKLFKSIEHVGQQFQKTYINPRVKTEVLSSSQIPNFIMQEQVAQQRIQEFEIDHEIQPYRLNDEIPDEGIFNNRLVLGHNFQQFLTSHAELQKKEVLKNLNQSL